MINAIIIDDETHCITALQNDLKMFCPMVNVVACCQSAKEGLLSIKRNNPDLVFLDVEMPWMNGFEMLELVDKEINFHVIFTTAYDQFAIKAFKVSAIDYLLKPVDSTDLITALGKVEKATSEKNIPDNVSNFLHNTHLAPEQQRLAIPNKDGYELVQVNKIIYCKATGAYTEIVLENRKKITLSKSLGEVEAILPGELFQRIHHSILVNVFHISQLKKTNGSFIIMDNGDELNIAKSKKELLSTRLGIK